MKRCGRALVAAGLLYSAATAAEPRDPLAVTRAVIEPTSGIVTVSGTLDCSKAGYDGRFDVIATIRQDPAASEPEERTFHGAVGLSTTVVPECRDRRIHDWSVQVQPISSDRFEKGRAGHIQVSALPIEGSGAGRRTASTEADIEL